MRNLLDISDVEKEVDGSSQKTIHKKQKALERSIQEGIGSSISLGLGANYITPFALALKSNAFQIGILSSFSGLISPLSQIFGAKLMKNYPRKKIVLFSVLLQALTWIPIALLSYLAWKEIVPLALPYLLIVLYSVLVAFGGIAFPPWFSWMGDLVPEKDRGRYFSIRNRATEAAGITIALIASFFLDYIKTKGLALLGFSILFLLAFTFRFISFIIFKKQYSPKLKLKRGDYFSLVAFLKRFDNFGKFAVFSAIFYFSLMIASPFFSVYMLEDLKFSYTSFIIVSMSASIYYLLFSLIIGKFSDKFGNKKLLLFGGLLFAINPLFWLFIKNPYLLVGIPQLVSGLANAALIIGYNNFTYDSVSQHKRGICVAYFNLLLGIGTFVGSILGGAIIKYVPITFMKPVFFVFVISAILRFLSTILFIPRLKESRKVKTIPLMHISVTHPFKTIHAEIGWFRTIFK